MIILHITSISNPSGNGVAVAVNEYVKYESKYAKVGLYNLEGNIYNNFCDSFDGNYKNIQDLPKPFCKPDLVIFNEVYKPKYILLYKECLERNIKYVIIPHGCLVKEAQKKHKIKKIIGNMLLFNRFIMNANAIQYLNENEKQKSKRFKCKKVIISGNGINVNNKKKNKYTNYNFIYIGRYSIYVKGLDLLLLICKNNKKWFKENNVKIELYGRDSLNGMSQLKKLVDKYDLNEILTINNSVFGKEKEKILLNSYCFIQLSRHEGQPMGIIESLSYGLPCIVTKGTAFGEYVNENDCGFGCLFDANDIFDKIKYIYNNKSERNIQSKNAIKSIKKDFDWDNIISKLVEEYKEV